MHFAAPRDAVLVEGPEDHAETLAQGHQVLQARSHALALMSFRIDNSTSNSTHVTMGHFYVTLIMNQLVRCMAA